MICNDHRSFIKEYKFKGKRKVSCVSLPRPIPFLPMCNYYDESGMYPVHIFNIFITNVCIHK